MKEMYKNVLERLNNKKSELSDRQDILERLHIIVNGLKI